MQDAFESMGGANDGKVSWWDSTFYCSVTPKDRRKAMDALYELCFEPMFESNEVEKSREVIRNELLEDELNVQSWMHKKMMSELYKNHPIRRPVGGSSETINRIEKQDIIDYHSKFYAPNVTSLAVVGDVDPDEIFKEAEEIFGKHDGNRRFN